MPQSHTSNTTSSDVARRKTTPASNASIKRNFGIFSGLVFLFTAPNKQAAEIVKGLTR
jgi:hypothetical protein